ncbi:metal-dependent transcriptional regulator [Anaerocolumna sp. MB42-C2]|uniref:metal-dependent transcriptional regulator n=1 Tax=Anaerocolumna sp. MB42-C2 TaxID=3070997 RepID=UPI0027DEEED4|nr:iron dependent repressor, metal binding and dimerization domain protein [Anaerocolumna sp. MB42-C2]WMJ88914.1 iron dependent repressor, metal binding and dimerization domain protein [Anaerocolumna sp. MB42-C2]
MQEHEFFTFREYMRKDQELLSASAEDYVEMIYRLSEKNGFTRVNDLAAALNVQPPSVTKMIQKLADINLLKYEKYGVIMLESNGVVIGKALLNRHNLIERFLTLLNIKDGLLDSTEKMEHTISNEILRGIQDFIEFFDNNPQVMNNFLTFRNSKDKH